MSKLKQEDAERIATEYVESIGVAPCVLDGSEFDDADNPSVWKVFFSFREVSQEWVGLPLGLVIEVNDSTGEAFHAAHL